VINYTGQSKHNQRHLIRQKSDPWIVVRQKYFVYNGYIFTKLLRNTTAKRKASSLDESGSIEHYSKSNTNKIEDRDSFELDTQRTSRSSSGTSPPFSFQQDVTKKFAENISRAENNVIPRSINLGSFPALGYSTRTHNLDDTPSESDGSMECDGDDIDNNPIEPMY
jgi:hypothetical protein